MRKNSQAANNCCRFVEVVERLPQCPCDCIPPIPTGPPCPFKPASGEPTASAVQSLLRQPNAPKSNCPLVEKPTQCQPADSSQLCVFSLPVPIDFKSLPRFTCTCFPGTCPELAKNVIRSLGFDPTCACPCPQTVKPTEPEPVEHRKKHKRRGKERTKSTPDSSNIDISTKSSAPNEIPSADPANMLRTPGVAENQTPGSPSVVQSAPAGASAGGAPGALAGGLAPRANAYAVKPHPQFENQKPKHSAYSGSSNGSLLFEGKGFKIFEIDGEKVLFNYSTKNCPLLKCKCSRNEDSCGCTEWARLTKYKNCVCPGARKFKKGQVLQYKGSS